MALRNFSWIVPGHLAGSAMPGGYSYIEDYMYSDLHDLYRQGIRCVVSLTHMVENFKDICQRAELRWINYPIPDFGVPDDIGSFDQLIENIIHCINQDIPVCVHCQAGIGRTGLVLSCALAAYSSCSAAEAISQVKKVRSAIETKSQYSFVESFLERKV